MRKSGLSGRERIVSASCAGAGAWANTCDVVVKEVTAKAAAARRVRFFIGMPALVSAQIT